MRAATTVNKSFAHIDVICSKTCGVFFSNIVVIFVIMKRIYLTVIAILALSLGIDACTSAIVSGRLTKNGMPLLWKNRDTDFEDNFVARVEPSGEDDIAYVALFNAGDSLLADAWIGVNEAGFAIMNTASYNLMPDTSAYKDREGAVMTVALKRCRTIDDFERTLAELPKPLGVQANFGVIDAGGHGAYFETDDRTYRKYALEEEPSGLMLRANYSYSGNIDEGFGYIRENNARYLLKPYIDGGNPITPDVFTDVLSRSFYHSLIGKDMLDTDSEWIVDQDFIPRRSTSASVVVGYDDNGKPVMWTVLGYPPCSYARKVTLDSIPHDMQPELSTWRSRFCDEVNERKAEVFPIKRGSGSHYINVSSLRRYNESFRRKSFESTYSK